MSDPVPDPDGTPEPGGAERDGLPGGLRLAAGLAGLEALLLAFFGVAELFSLTGARVAMGLTTTVFFLVYGAGLAWCAWRLALRESWARAPVVLAQLIQLGVAWSFRGEGTTGYAAALAVVAVAVLVGIFQPAALRALAQD